MRFARVCCRYHCAFLASFHSPKVFFEQMSICTALPKLLPKSFKLLLPFFPTGTMERITRLGEVATASTLARILSTISSCAKGPCQICIYDIHALQNQFYFNDKVLIRLGSCIDLLLRRLEHLPESEQKLINIAFPDDGASKRFGDLFHHRYAHPCICHKVRGEGDKRVVKLKEGDVQGKHVVIVDDLVQSGSTLIECARELKAKGAAKCSAYVTHAIFPNESWRKFCEDERYQGLFEYFWCTDSNPSVSDQLHDRPPFQVLSSAPMLAEVILDDTA